MPVIEVLDIGAMADGVDRYQPLVEQSLAFVTGFEPNPEQFERLCSLDGPRRYHPYFLGPGGPAVFHVTRYPGCCSLLEPDPAVIDIFTGIGASEGGNFTVIATEHVETKRLDEVPGLTPPDFIKLDVQGAELSILEHGTRVLSSALVVELEVEFLPLYKGQPLYGDVESFMRRQGFLPHKLIDVAGRCLRPFSLPKPSEAMSQVLWADAIFIRDFVAIENYSTEELLKAALILNDLYLSFDLVNYLLSEFDLRTGADLSARFVDKLSQNTPLPRLYLNMKD
jgi:FkbM family methyltransferase